MTDLLTNLGEYPARIQEEETKNAIDRLGPVSTQTVSETDIHTIVDLIKSVSTETARENLGILLYYAAPANPAAIGTRVEELLDYAIQYPAIQEDILWAIVVAIYDDPDTAKRLLSLLEDRLDSENERLYGVAVLAYYLGATADEPSTRARMRLRASQNEAERQGPEAASEVIVARAITFDERSTVLAETETILRQLPETETRLLRNVQLFFVAEATGQYPTAIADIMDDTVANRLFELLRANPNSKPLAYAVSRLVVLSGDEQLIDQLREIAVTLSATTEEFVNSILEEMTHPHRESADPFGLRLFEVLQLKIDEDAESGEGSTEFSFYKMRFYIERLRNSTELSFTKCERRAERLREFVSNNNVSDGEYGDVIEELEIFENQLERQRPDDPAERIREQEPELYREISKRIADICDMVEELYTRNL